MRTYNFSTIGDFEREVIIERSCATRRKRADLRAQMVSGDVGIIEAFEQVRYTPELQGMKLSTFLNAVPGIGQRTIERVFEEFDIHHRRRIGALTEEKYAELHEWLTGRLENNQER